MFLFKFVSEHASVECRFPWSFLARAILHQDIMQAHIAKNAEKVQWISCNTEKQHDCGYDGTAIRVYGRGAGVGSTHYELVVLPFPVAI